MCAQAVTPIASDVSFGFCRIFCLLLDTLKLFLNYQFVSFALGEHKTGHRAFSHPLREDSETLKTRYAGLQVPESHGELTHGEDLPQGF